MSAFTEEIRAALALALADYEPRLRQIVRDELLRARTVGDPDQLLTTEQAATLRGTSLVAFRRARERGTLGIEPVRVGRRALRWRRGDVISQGVQR